VLDLWSAEQVSSDLAQPGGRQTYFVGLLRLKLLCNRSFTLLPLFLLYYKIN